MIAAIGLDWKSAAASEREICERACNDDEAFMISACEIEGVRGCVLLRTCGRFETYLDLEDGYSADDNLRSAIASMMGFNLEVPQSIFLLSGVEAHRRVMEIASGLQSQVLGEDQIIAQVKGAISNARECKCTTPWLETLFRLAITAGKEVITKVRLKTVPSSSSHRAFELACEILGDLAGKRALVIGNGEMGQIMANLLVDAGCEVSVTLRTFRHGSTVVPKGCFAVNYEDRASAIEGCELVVSATRSPHTTISVSMVEPLESKPSLLIDLAMPRDIDPACRDIDGVRLLDIDDLVDDGAYGDPEGVRRAEAIIDEKLSDYMEWERNRAERLGTVFTGGRIAVFAGTTEGRELCELMSESGLTADVYTATGYGASLLSNLVGITVHPGRIDADGMVHELAGAVAVVDATHPYAHEVSDNIRTAAEKVGARYIRVLRLATPHDDDAVVVGSAEEAAEFLAAHEGNILLTTGSKDLPAYTSIPDFASRVYPRVLPDPDSLNRALSLGYLPSRIICMQGPFSRDMNVATLESIDATWMVTKDTGKAGGFADKIEAAHRAGAKVILIARPVADEQGVSVQDALAELAAFQPHVEVASTKDKSAKDNFSCVVKAADTAASTGLSNNANAADTAASTDFSSNANSADTDPDTATNPDTADIDPNKDNSTQYMRFPVFIDLMGARCIVAGGGEVGKRRAGVLAKFGADVTILDPNYVDAPDNVRFEQRAWADKDELGCTIVVAATNDRTTNEAIVAACKNAGVLVNVSDSPKDCDFFFPAICEGKNLIAGISSDGAHHSLVAEAARVVREILKEVDA